MFKNKIFVDLIRLNLYIWYKGFILFDIVCDSKKDENRLMFVILFNLWFVIINIFLKRFMKYNDLFSFLKMCRYNICCKGYRINISMWFVL